MLKDDFSDVIIGEFIGYLENKDNVDEIKNRLDDLITEENAGVLIDKLRTKEKILDERKSYTLSIAICLLATKYPNPKHAVGWFDHPPHTQAAILVNMLIQNIKKENRINHVIKCIQKSTTPAFQLEIFWWLNREDDNRPEKDAFNAEEMQRIEKALAECLRNYIHDTDDITLGSAHILSQIFRILNKYFKQTITEHMELILKSDESAIIRLLEAYTGTTFVENVAQNSDFERDEYEALISIFTPEWILSAIKTYLGQLPDIQEICPVRVHSDNEQIVLEQFVWVHNQLTENED